jgi:DnaJ-class molecular chaperone
VIQRRTNRAPLAMGSFVPLLGSGYAAPSSRTCARCKCRLSRYAAQTETTCAPCEATVNPWAPPAMRTRKSDECPTCGGLKQRVSKRCRKCADAGIRLDFSTHGFIK